MDLRVCFLGDSYVLGQGDEDGLGWPGRVFTAARSRGADLTAYNLGVRGDTAAQVAARAAAETKARFRSGDKKAVVLAFGANDIFQGVSPSETAVSLDALLGWADRQRYWAFVVSPPPIRGERAAAGDRLREELAKVCAKRAAPHLDLAQAISGWDLWWDQAAAGDGAHPGGAAYAMVAEAFDAWAPWREWLGVSGA